MEVKHHQYHKCYRWQRVRELEWNICFSLAIQYILIMINRKSTAENENDIHLLVLHAIVAVGMLVRATLKLCTIIGVLFDWPFNEKFDWEMFRVGIITSLVLLSNI